MDKFFDCLNVRNTEEHKINLKSFLRPYRNVNDVRFAWLDEFLQHLENWKTSTPERVGNFSQRDREAMFLPWQTYEALRMTILSLKGVVPYLLTKGLKYVLSEKFCQDDIESYWLEERQTKCKRHWIYWQHSKISAFCTASRKECPSGCVEMEFNQWCIANF